MVKGDSQGLNYLESKPEEPAEQLYKMKEDSQEKESFYPSNSQKIEEWINELK